MPATAMAQPDAGDFAASDSALGRFVLMDPLSGPTGSPKGGAAALFGGAGVLGEINTCYPTYTGGLSTGIGLGPANDNNSANQTAGSATIDASAIQGTTPATSSRSFIDDLLVGARQDWQDDVPPLVAFDSELVYIGGGRSPTIAPDAAGGQDGFIGAEPYETGTLIAGFGQTVERDGGAGPAFTGFPLKVVTAVGAVAAGAAVEAGFLNVTGGAMVAGQSTFGSSTTEDAAPT